MVNFLCEIISLEGTGGLSGSNCGLPCKFGFLGGLETKITMDIISIKHSLP
jgi:hypothetical protein